ncbi:MAG TPA: LysM domain-containing protein, partial [Bacteroidia bacterium]|nr:LysM domain-containing protein [Bacteroidia bacterium]
VESGSLTPASYPTYAEASAARTSGGFVGPADESGPVELASASGSSSSSAANTASAAKYHKVVSGDTLFSLAGKY